MAPREGGSWRERENVITTRGSLLSGLVQPFPTGRLRLDRRRISAPPTLTGPSVTRCTPSPAVPSRPLFPGN